MSLERGVELFAIIHLGIIGLSHILAPKAWARFFILLRSKEDAGVFVVAFMCLGFGSIVAAFHPVWTGIPLVLTLLGWAQVLKALIYFAFPQFGLKQLQRVSVEGASMFIYPGVGFVALTGLFAYHLITTRPVG